ncbi:hypothetical protein QR77_16160 [Streptomyces sp. 150FB]|uniref:hypothetical protein n=1 Tax=Streptomyces sp. 150FB TaxID=1576605 RepID=UPI00058903F7|nr:hypothetical protein [Streptomyces sp. 150FB]KIF75051.1 hypothetical protein QR77_16160 [Streptomyces sp. 150FB]
MRRLVLAFATLTLAAAWPLALAAPAGADAPATHARSSASAPVLHVAAKVPLCCESVSVNGTGLGCVKNRNGDPTQCVGVPAECDSLMATVGRGCVPVDPSLAARDTQA